MTISGYTWAINASKKLLPYEACIKSMLLLADEVYVAYDSRYDAPETFTQIDERVTTISQKFDAGSIQNEGQMLSMARAHCKGDWLIWLDLDEILHEKDVTDILNLIQYAENTGYTSLEIGFYSYISKNFVFPDFNQWCARPKIMKNFRDVLHGIDQRLLQQRGDGTDYLSGGDGIDFIKDGQVFAYHPLPYRDFVLMQKLQNNTATCEDIIKSTEYFPYIYHYARYSMQRKARMMEGDRYTYFVGARQGHSPLPENYAPEQWIKEFAMPVIMEQQKELRPEGYLGEVEPVHPQCIKEWTEFMDGFMNA